jgi:hypothetical protein
MIRFQAKSNLDEVLDYIYSMPNQIEMLVSQTMADSVNDLQIELPARFGNAANDVVVTLGYDGGEISISVDEINPYHLLNATGETYDDVVLYIEEFISNKLAENFRNAGYDYGN